MKYGKTHSWRCRFLFNTAVKYVLFFIFCFLSSAAAETMPGGFLVNGQKTFPLGWYALHKFPELGIPALGLTPLDESMRHGFDYVMPYYIRGEGEASLFAYMDAAHDRGVKVMIDMHPIELNAITTWVNIVKNHPGLYGYYLDDEPEIRGIPASDVIAKYNAVKAADPDPNHIVLLVIYSPLSKHTAYLPACDVVGRELYSLNLYSQVQADIAAAKKAGKAYLALPGLYQAFGYSLPSPAEFRYMVFAPVSMGADGIMPFIFEGAESKYGLPSPGFRDTIAYPATDQLKSLLPTFLKGNAGLTASCSNTYNGDITWVFAGDGNDAVLIAVNNNRKRSRAKVGFTLSGLDPSIVAAKVLGENRTISLTSGNFSDKFAALGVHIYLFESLSAAQAGTP
ncbi:MAG TPA: hypothetical protein DDW84_03590 [Phycisphaerales bacterium]|nr:MAG: hypothetical protein A2Y13_05580 [Planctomycetes bacterium GWC2_45_44]HBG77922.1 hypothetical protein [Phycisphaerales bacterium]HBR19943.1 hypothetical protein [Phycisphaerales bacterium]